MFMFSLLKAAIHLGLNLIGKPGASQEHELWGDWTFIQYHSEVDIGTSWRNSVRTVNRIHFSLMDEISIVPRSSDPVVKSKSTCLLTFRSMIGKDERQQRCNCKMGRSSGRTQDVSCLQWNVGNRKRSTWIWAGIFPKIYVNEDSSRDPEGFAKTEYRTRKIHRLDHLHVNFQRHRLDKTRNRRNLYFEFRIKVKEYANRFSQRHWTLLGLGDEKKWYDCSLRLQENRIIQPVRWWSDSKIRVFQYSVLRVVEFWKRRMAETPTFQCGCFRDKTFVPNHSLCKTAQY